MCLDELVKFDRKDISMSPVNLSQMRPEVFDQDVQIDPTLVEVNSDPLMKYLHLELLLKL